MNYKAPDNSLHFIEPEYAHLLPAGCVPIAPEEAEALRPVIEAPKPTTVSMAQARLALHQLGLLDAVEAGISSMGKVAQIEWEFRATVQRDSALVLALASALQLDTQALDDLFILADTL